MKQENEASTYAEKLLKDLFGLVDTGFTEINTKFTEINTKFTKIDTELTQVNHNIQIISQEISSIHLKVDQLEAKVDLLETKVGKLENRVGTLENYTMNGFREINLKLEHLTEETTEIKKEITNIKVVTGYDAQLKNLKSLG
ncbi:MAG: hypothetical protein ACTHMV_19230 [Chitinophagaceae bacterium]